MQVVNAYAERNKLDVDQAVGDGFYDPGRGRPSRSLAEWRAEPLDLDRREVLMVDLARLRPLVETVGRQIAPFTSTDEKFKAIAQTCSVVLGGSAAMRDTSLTDKSVREIKQRLRSNVVPLHELLERNGVCRHRALLFKVLCDELSKRPEHGANLHCRLVRGDYESHGAGGGHAWNVVLSGAVTKLCDIMHKPGTLYAETSEKAEHYKRLTGDFQLGGVGGASVPIPSRCCRLKA